MIFLYISLLFILLKAAADISMVVIAYAALTYIKFKVSSGPSTYERLKRAFKAF